MLSAAAGDPLDLDAFDSNVRGLRPLRSLPARLGSPQSVGRGCRGFSQAPCATHPAARCRMGCGAPGATRPCSPTRLSRCEAAGWSFAWVRLELRLRQVGGRARSFRARCVPLGACACVCVYWCGANLLPCMCPLRSGSGRISESSTVRPGRHYGELPS